MADVQVRNVFGGVEVRWVEGDFPFTTPSLELEILFRGSWLEVWRHARGGCVSYSY